MAGTGCFIIVSALWNMTRTTLTPPEGFASRALKENQLFSETEIFYEAASFSNDGIKKNTAILLFSDRKQCSNPVSKRSALHLSHLRQAS